MSKKLKKSKKVVKKIVAKSSKQSDKKVKGKIKNFAGPLKVSKPFNKSQIASAIADITCVNKKNVVSMLDALFEIMAAHLKRNGVGEFTLPGIAKFRAVNKPAIKAREGVNPFTGKPMTFAAKPARNVVKIRALKKIKDIAK